MNKLFYIGLAGLLLFEIMNVYFIMPLPKSQQINSIDFSYFLYSWRWVIRISFLTMIILGAFSAFTTRKKWRPLIAILLTTTVVYIFNFIMSADKMFLQPNHLVFKSESQNRIPKERLVIGVAISGEAKAYPVEFLTFHHQIRDSIGGKQLLITYCSVCRTGRVYEPIINGVFAKFRLVGMDHFNAMFEDEFTKSWWRQATGEAITGILKGKILPEVESKQMTINKWFELHPSGKVMQADESFLPIYDTLAKFEQGKSEGNLTRTDSLSWENKSWVVGILASNYSKAYDWNTLIKEVVINDSIGGINIVLAISSDRQSFVAFERPSNKSFWIKNDTLFSKEGFYNFLGHNLKEPTKRLNSIKAYQEFWHSWLYFHPNTQKYITKINNR